MRVLSRQRPRAWRGACRAAVLLVCAGCGLFGGPRLHVFHGDTMGTTYTVKVAGAALDEAARARVDRMIRDTLDAVNGAMSTYRPESELSRFNRSVETTPFAVSGPLLEVMARAAEISARTDGAFDITVGPLVNAWGFGPDATPSREPTDEELEALRARVGYTMLEIDRENGTVRKERPDLYCDLSAIAKGYAVDRIAGALEAEGLDHYMVEVGGEVRTGGFNAEGRPWRIGIVNPGPDGNPLNRAIPLSGMALATSGDYLNYRMRDDGARLSHTIDPQTGRPITHNLASVSVLHEECMTADALATAFMVMGAERAFDLASEGGIAALFLVRESDGTFAARSTSRWDAVAGRHTIR